MAAARVRHSHGGLPPTVVALFSSLFLLAGLSSLGFLLPKIYVDYLTRTRYRMASCTLVSKEIVQSTNRKRKFTYRPKFEWDYVVEGRSYRAMGYNCLDFSAGYEKSQEILRDYEVGGVYSCLYDPEHPAESVLERASLWYYLYALIPLGLLAVGGIGLFWSIRKIRKKPHSAGSASFRPK